VSGGGLGWETGDILVIMFCRQVYSAHGGRVTNAHPATCEGYTLKLIGKVSMYQCSRYVNGATSGCRCIIVASDAYKSTSEVQWAECDVKSIVKWQKIGKDIVVDSRPSKERNV